MDAMGLVFMRALEVKLGSLCLCGNPLNGWTLSPAENATL